MELICVNSKYTQDYLTVFTKYSIKYPQENEICELLRIIKYPRIGKTGLIIKGYEGQFISGEIMGIKGEVEVSFNKERFRTLQGLILTEEMLKEEKIKAKDGIELIEKSMLKDFLNK